MLCIDLRIDGRRRRRKVIAELIAELLLDRCHSFVIDRDEVIIGQRLLLFDRR